MLKLVLVAGLLSSAFGAFFDVSLGDAAWARAYPTCAIPATTRLAPSPQAVPALPTVDPQLTPLSADIQVEAATASAPVAWPFVVQPASKGGYVFIDLALSSSWLVFNGSRVATQFVELRRPAEHLPPGVTAADAASMVEQRVYLGNGNTTSFALARIFRPGSHGTDVESLGASAFIEGVARALKSGRSTVTASAEMPDYGLANGDAWLYVGTTTSPPCQPILWSVELQPRYVSQEVIDAIPLGWARATKAAASSNASAFIRVSGVAARRRAAFTAVLDPTAPSVADVVARGVAEFSNAGAVDDIVDGTLLRIVVYMLAAMCAILAAALAALGVARMTYRPPERSTWSSPRSGAQFFGFGPSTLYAEELEERNSTSAGSVDGSGGSDDDEDEE